jgi:hypothetical protein
MPKKSEALHIPIPLTAVEALHTGESIMLVRCSSMQNRNHSILRGV